MSDPQDDKTARDTLREVLASAPVQFWICPIEAHHHDYPEPPREIVRWIDGVAHCMEPGCGRTSADPVRPQDDWPRVKCGLNGCENTLRDIDPTADKSQDPEWWMQFCSREHRDAWEENHDITLADLVRPQETLRDRFAVALRNASTSGVVDIHISKANACLLADAVLPIMEEETARQLAALRDKVKALVTKWHSDEQHIKPGRAVFSRQIIHTMEKELRALVEEPQGGEGR